MKSRVLLLLLASAMLLAGCVTTSGYRSGHSVGVGYSHGRQSAVYGYQRAYPGGYGYYGYGQDPYRGGYYGDGYGGGYYGGGYRYGGRSGYGGSYSRYGDPYGYGDPYRGYRADPYRGYRGYPYSVPRYRVIGPAYPGYGYPHYRPGHRHPNVHITPPRHGGRPPWRNTRPPPPVVTPVAPPPQLPGSDLEPGSETPRGDVERGLRRYKGGEVPLRD